MYDSENLSLIGGFQDTNKQLQLLFFKLDRKPYSNAKFFVETYVSEPNVSADNQRVAIESLVNSAHLESQGILRCSLGVGDSKNRT